MKRDVSPEEFAKIKEQVLDVIKNEYPNIKPEEFTPLKDKLLDAAARLAESTPEMASGGPLERFLKGGWRATLGTIVPTLQGISDMYVDAPANAMREGAAAIEAAKEGSPAQVLTHVRNAIPIVGPMLSGMEQTAQEHFAQAKDLYDQGEYNRAIGYAVGGAVPMVGPALVAAGERGRSGDVAGMFGEALGTVGFDLVPKGAKVRIPAFLRNPDAHQSSLFGRMFERGADIDVATASNRPFTKTLQRAGSEGAVGTTVVPFQVAKQQATYAREADRLAGESTGLSVPVEEWQAANQAEEMVAAKRDVERAAGRAHYSDFDMYAAMADEEWIPKSEQILDPKRQARAEHSLGRQITVEEAQELRRIQVEMERGFQKRTRNEIPRGHGSDAEWGAGSAGAKVFDDINNAMPGRNKYDLKSGEVKFTATEKTRGEVVASLKKALATGHFDEAGRAAMKVVEERLANPSGKVAKNADLPKSAGVLMEERRLPVDVTEAKASLRREYEQQKRVLASSNTPGDQGFKALATFMEGPDVIDAVDLDQVLSKFKAAGRDGAKVADADALTKQSQRLAYQVTSVLEPLLDEKIKGVPGMSESLQAGRAHWVEMSKIDETLEKLKRHESAVSLFDKLAGRTGAEFLDEVASIRPDAIPYIAKGKLDQLNEFVFRDKNPKKAWDEFKRMDSRTLKIMFPGEGHVEALRDIYETMALRAENVNPSGTAFGVAKLAEAGTLAGSLFGLQAYGVNRYALAPIVSSAIYGAMGVLGHSTAVAKTLSQGKTIPLANKAALLAWAKRLNLAVADAKKEMKDQGLEPPTDIQLPAMPRITIQGQQPQSPPPR